jgi:hypothetical protein
MLRNEPVRFPAPHLYRYMIRTGIFFGTRFLSRLLSLLLQELA